MRVVVTGASGNVGTSLLRALADDDRVDGILGLARRRPSREVPKTEWRSADIERNDLESTGPAGSTWDSPSRSWTRPAREVLGWEPRHSSVEAIRDVLSGIADAAGEPTPPLESARR